MKSTIVLTDLDSTLLDHESYSWEPARPALDRMRADNIPCIFVTSKTRAEVEYWRRQLGNTHPYIVENGGALVVPGGYFSFSIPDAIARGDAWVVEWGTVYAELVDALKQAANKTECAVRGFSDMSVAEIARLCSFSEEHAALAKRREYDEPYVLEDPACSAALHSAVEELGLRSTVGGRFHHVTGANDKGRAVRSLITLFERASEPVISIGLGDSFNDIPFLESVTHPVLMPSPALDQMQRLMPGASVAPGPGPKGWSDAILSLLPKPA